MIHQKSYTDLVPANQDYTCVLTKHSSVKDSKSTASPLPTALYLKHEAEGDKLSVDHQGHSSVSLVLQQSCSLKKSKITLPTIDLFEESDEDDTQEVDRDNGVLVLPCLQKEANSP